MMSLAVDTVIMPTREMNEPKPSSIVVSKGGSRKFFQRDPVKAGHHRPFSGVPMKAQYYWLGSFVIFRGSGPLLLKTLYFCNYQGGSDPLHPTPWIRTCSKRRLILQVKLV